MNLDFALVNRALQNLGMAPLTMADRVAGNAAWVTAADYFLHTMLEALAQAEWTGAKRRRELAPARMPYKGSPDFSCAYDLPIDCAKPVELDERVYYEIEGPLLFTDADPARLLYVSNGRRFRLTGPVSGGGACRQPSTDYLSGGGARRERRVEPGDGILNGGSAVRKPPPPPPDEDFPDYREQRMEPNFYLYWEFLLSSKYALRLTDQPELASLYFGKALAIGKAAETVSLQRAAGRRTATPTWQEELGLG